MNLQNLLFRVSLLDNMSAPVGRMMQTLDRVTTQTQAGFNKIGYGVAGLAGAGYALDNILQPAKDMQAALGSIKSLSVGQDVLDNLNKTALKFSLQYGGSASDFVKSSYDIQSAIAGLSGNELPAFTNASAILAKGTKADAASITNYVGTMYTIFQKNADAMGKAKWVEQLAGQTAMAVNIFKSDGAKMAQSFQTLGAKGDQAGIRLSEQFAVLGKLQGAFDAGAAGTKYTAFLSNVGKAQEKLGLKFTDSQDHMLPMVDILSKINGKFKDLSKVSNADLIQKAFGSKEALDLIQLLSSDVAGLNKNINLIGSQTDLTGVTKMANDFTMPWERSSSAVTVLFTILGQKMLPILTPLFNGVTNVAGVLMTWANLFPEIAGYIGLGVVSIIGLIAGFATLSIVAGVSSLVMAGWGVAVGAVNGVMAILKFSVLQALPAIWGFTAALLANPITWWVVGITAVVAIVAIAIVKWDTWTQAVINFAAHWLELIGAFALVDAAISGWERLKIWWSGFQSWLAGLNLFAPIVAAANVLVSGFEVIKSWWVGFKSWLSGLNPFAGLSSLMNGIRSITGAKLPQLNMSTQQGIAAPQALKQSGTANVPKGGIMSQISNSNSKAFNVGGITINNYDKPVNGFKLVDEMAMAAG